MSELRGQSAFEVKIQRNLRTKIGLAYKTEAFCCRCRHFPVSSAFKTKIKLKIFRGCKKFLEVEKAARKQRPEIIA